MFILLFVLVKLIIKWIRQGKTDAEIAALIRERLEARGHHVGEQEAKAIREFVKHLRRNVK